MYISLKWLKDYIDLDLPINEISEILTAIGLEVEGVEEKELVPGGLKGVVVGQVSSCGKHPNADRLSLTTVDIGTGESLQIVCGAPNVAEGQKVLVATVGTTLHPSNGEAFKIKKGKIRGELSMGMICAEDELGLGNNHDGIIVLPEEVSIGMPAAEFYEIENDTVFDIGLTPNRSDATCHLGVAEDLAAYLKINKDPNTTVKHPSVGKFSVANHNCIIKVNLENEQACPRYTGVCISNIEVKESPDWLKKYLVSIGQRPINNIVDITNFILHELGQPLHAFDLDKINGQEIRVKNLAEGSEFVSLDEVERKLSNEDLMICDGDDKPLCIGGVFGGLHSGVTEKTSSIFLEAAHFSAKGIRRSMTRHGLWTDAARVFEKGSDPNKTEYALKRAAILITELAGGQVCSDIIDIYPEEIKPKEIHLRYHKLNELIGNDISKDEVHEILTAMDMEVLPVDEFGVKVRVPTNKSDVLREVDLIEEVLRIYGFNKVEISEKIVSTIQYEEYPSKYQLVNTISDFLASRGWNEMMGMSLMESRKCKDALSFDESDLVYVNNTSNVHLDIMRPDMLLSGLQVLLHNQNHQQLDCRLFEIGRSYKALEEGFQEIEYLTLFLKGNQNKASWETRESGPVELHHLQSEIDALMRRLSLNANKLEESSDDRFDLKLDYLVHNKALISLGIVSSKLQSKFDIKGNVFFAEIRIDALLQAVKRSSMHSKEISKFPGTSRDLALVVDKKVKFSEILSIARKIDKQLIQDIDLFDVYENEKQLGSGKKSYAVKYQFEDQSKTLNDKEVDKVMDKLIQAYENQIGALIRK